MKSRWQRSTAKFLLIVTRNTILLAQVGKHIDNTASSVIENLVVVVDVLLSMEIVDKIYKRIQTIWGIVISVTLSPVDFKRHSNDTQEVNAIGRTDKISQEG